MGTMASRSWAAAVMPNPYSWAGSRGSGFHLPRGAFACRIFLCARPCGVVVSPISAVSYMRILVLAVLVAGCAPSRDPHTSDVPRKDPSSGDTDPGTDDTAGEPTLGALSVTNSTESPLYTVFTCLLDGTAPCSSHNAMQGAQVVAVIEAGASWDTDLEAGIWWAGVLTDDLACEWSDEFEVVGGETTVWGIDSLNGSWDTESERCNGG